MLREGNTNTYKMELKKLNVVKQKKKACCSISLVS